MGITRYSWHAPPAPARSTQMVFVARFIPVSISLAVTTSHLLDVDVVDGLHELSLDDVLLGPKPLGVNHLHAPVGMRLHEIGMVGANVKAIDVEAILDLKLLIAQLANSD